MKTQLKTEARTPSPSKAQDRPTASPVLVATMILSLGMSSSQAQPANDLFANRIILSGTNIVATGSNVGATKEPGEPNHAGGVGGASIWWEWTAPSSDTFTISTVGSSFDTLLGVYTGASVSALTTIASNDDDPSADYESRVMFGAVSNQTYQIAVDGYGGDSGSVQLLVKVGPPELMTWGAYDFYIDPYHNHIFLEAFVPAGLSNVMAIATGQHHSLALTAEGKVVAWGIFLTFYSQLMGGRVVYPAFVPAGLSNVVAIAGGSCHSLALTAEGRVVAWGRGHPFRPSLAQTNVPAGLSNVVAIAAGGDGESGHSLALTTDGRVVAWGVNDAGQTNVPSGLSNVVAIAAGVAHSLALTTEGRVVAWGYNYYGQTNVPSGLSNVIAIAAGGEHSLALTTGGGVVAWGDNYYGQTNVPSGLSNVVAIAAGAFHNLALTAEGRVVAWGDNEYGGTNAPIGLSSVVAIAAGGGYTSGHSLALTRQPSMPAPGLELSRGVSGLELQALGTPGISCQLLRATGLAGPWLPTQPVAFTNTVQLLRAPDISAPAQFFRLLRK